MPERNRLRQKDSRGNRYRSPRETYDGDERVYEEGDRSMAQDGYDVLRRDPQPKVGRRDSLDGYPMTRPDYD